MPSDWAFVSGDIELTNKCGSKCLMCPRDAITRLEGMMTEDTFNVVSEKLINEKSLITFSGMGDPLSHPNVFKWIFGVRRKGGDVGIVVNPASLSSNISQKLVEASPNSITLSFSSVRKKVFERLCPGISFEEALKRAMELIDLARGNVGLRVTGIITEINREESEVYGRFWKDLGVHASMTACHSRGGNLKVPVIYEQKSFGPESGECGLFQFHTFITWEGDVLACCHDLTGSTRIGSLVNEGISVISEQKQRITNEYMPFSVCRQCDEPLRQCKPPQGYPPIGWKERNSFFRTLRKMPMLGR